MFMFEEAQPEARDRGTTTAPRPAVELRADVRAAAENRAGVYRMIGPGDRVLYVGKSVRVRSRLLSYFREPADSKASEILRNTHRIEWDYTGSEFAALLVEMKSIKRWLPPYNVVHKRDRAYCFIRLTSESAPRLQAVPRVRADGSRYYGPFAGPARVRLAVREIGDALELRDCAGTTPVHFADQLDFFQSEPRAPLCLRADLGRCLAPCAARCTRADYHDRANSALRFLSGEAEAPLDRLRSRLEGAVSRLNFEYAATVRDRIQRLEELRDELISLRGTIEALTFTYRVPGADGGERMYIIRKGLVLADLAAPRDPGAEAALRRRAERILLETARGLDAVGPAEATEILMVARWFRLRPEELGRTWRPGEPELDVELPA
jgi:excinuclease ABC subunit C